MPNRNSRFAHALAWANDKHWDQRRNGTEIPYISHLLAVTSLVMENGGNEDECIAALLHDTLEDCEDVNREVLAQRFGDRVADIVYALSDADIAPGETKGPWEERKVRYLKHLRECGDRSVLLVSNADKLHNATSILRDLRDPEVGEAVWDRFVVARSKTLWYYESLTEIFAEFSPARRLARELSEVVSALRAH